MMGAAKGLTARRFYALIWKDFVVHKRHYIWTMLEITIPVLVCAMAILSNSHQGKPKLENERTFDQDDYERIYGDLTPSRHKLLVAPNSSFTRALVDQIDDGAVSVELCNSERELIELIKREIPVSLDQVKRLLPDDSSNVTIGGVVIRSDEQLASSSAKFHQTISRLDGKPMRIPVNFDMSIRAKDFRLGPEPFPKKYSLGPFIHADHYSATFFMASQIMLSRAYINLLAAYVNTTSGSGSNVIPGNEDIVGQQLPYPKYVAHRRLKETTLGTFVAGSQKQKPFVLTMDYCITVGFLVTAIFLAKRIVDEKKSKVRDMLRLVGISDWTYYGSHVCNTMLIMLVQCALITLLFTGHSEAPAQNIQSSLLFVILLLYCASSILFVLFLSTLFNSSTKAIIFTSLLWLGLPEILDRIFKMGSGVIESNGFLQVEEQMHLMFCLLPNFGLRLMNRLLTECDIYGEFFDKKQLYGEYRAIWPNLFNVLPLYRSITVGHIMIALLVSIPIYALLIYAVNSVSLGQTGMASLGQSEGEKNDKKGNKLLALLGWLLNFSLSLIVAPFKLICSLILANEQDSSSQQQQQRSASWSAANINQSAPNVIFIEGSKVGGYLNNGYSTTASSIDDLKMSSINSKQQILNCNSLQSGDNLKILNSACGSQQQLQSLDDDAEADPKYFETAPKMLSVGVSIRNLNKTYFTSSSKLRRIEAVKNVSLDMFYSQILGKFTALVGCCHY